jgi:ketosteroid isomerase-like protein
MTNEYKSDDIAALYKVFEDAVTVSNVEQLLAGFYTQDVAFVGTGLPLSQGPEVKDILSGLCAAVRSVRVEQLQTIVVEPQKVLIDFAIVHAENEDGTSSVDHSTCVFHYSENGWRCITDVIVRQ